MAYTGNRDTLFSYRGPATGEKYLVSSLPHERIVQVYVEDVPGLVATGEWLPVDAPGDGG